LTLGRCGVCLQVSLQSPTAARDGRRSGLACHLSQRPRLDGVDRVHTALAKIHTRGTSPPFALQLYHAWWAGNDAGVRLRGRSRYRARFLSPKGVTPQRREPTGLSAHVYPLARRGTVGLLACDATHGEAFMESRKGGEADSQIDAVRAFRTHCFMQYGIDRARRGWLGKGHAVNTLTWPQFRQWLGRRHPVPQGSELAPSACRSLLRIWRALSPGLRGYSRSRIGLGKLSAWARAKA
jgi:hypothetical protein